MIRFGEFELDEHTLELRKSGAPVRIQQQPARILAFLLKHRGTLVTREQIRSAIWGEDTYVDFEQGLNFCIRQIRLALNDQAEKPLYIETLPRLGYRFVPSIEQVSERAPAPEQRRTRIGLVPIDHLGGAEEDYFAAGLSDDMISALARIDPSRLRVTMGPRMSVTQPLAEQLERMQRELDLDFLLRLSIRRSPDTIKISTQLHDLRDRSVVWSQAYNRKSSDLLAMQEEVTGDVSRALAMELLPSPEVGSRKYARSAAAYDAYLKGRYFWHRITSEGIRNSLTYFNEAIALDAEFAPAYAGLADCYAQMGSVRVALMQPIEALAKCRPLLQRAMDMDNTMTEAYCTLGLLKSWYDLDWNGAARAFQTAISLDASNSTALLWQSLYFSGVGRHAESLASVRKARDLEPLSPIVNMYIGMAQTHSGNYDLGARTLQSAIELDPQYYRPYMFLGRVYSYLERHEEALVAFRRALALNPENLEALAFMADSLAPMGDLKGVQAILKKLDAASARTGTDLMKASVYSALGDSDKTFSSLERARENKNAPLYIFIISPSFRKFRDDPRYESFRKSLNVPPGA